MRGPLFLLVAAFLTATPALAQDPLPAENTRAACTDGRDNDGDGHVDCADQDCQDFTFCAQNLGAHNLGGAAPDELAHMRGRGTTFVVVGAVLLSLGVVVGGTSSLLWINSSDAYRDGAISMDVFAAAMLGSGTSLLAIGAGKLAEARRPRVALGPTSIGVHF
jgi:hypothetical protein